VVRDARSSCKGPSTPLNRGAIADDAVKRGEQVAGAFGGRCMARMYSSRKGVSGSSKPHVTEAPAWSNTDVAAIEGLIHDYHKAGHSTAEIGALLRDRHAVPNARLVLGRRITAVLAEAGSTGTYPEDMMNLMRRAVGLIDHMGSNHKDLHNRRALELTEAKIRRLASYYVGEGRLPSDWRYKRDQLRLMVE